MGRSTTDLLVLSDRSNLRSETRVVHLSIYGDAESELQLKHRGRIGTRGNVLEREQMR